MADLPVFTELNLKQLNNAYVALNVRLTNKKRELATLKNESAIYGTPAQISNIDSVLVLVDRIRTIDEELVNVQAEITRLRSQRLEGEALTEVLSILNKYDVSANDINGLPTPR